MVCMFLFHSHILLLKSDAFKDNKRQFEQQDKKRDIQDFFETLLKTESSLPVQFCIDILTKYLMFDEALKFLFYRKDYKDLLKRI
jgi:hypothetical protein